MIRLMPPASGLANTITFNGRTYTCASGSTIDVVDADAYVMMANGWTQAAGAVGTTAQRPQNPKRGDDYHDTTLGKNVRWDGKAWRDPATGGSV